MAFPTGWLRKCIITVPDAQISGSNINFPIFLTQDNFPSEMLDGGSNSALNGGGDVRFSEDAAGTVQLPCDVVSFVTGGTPSAEIHVKLPTLNTGADKTFYVWYKKTGEVQPAVTATYGRNAVWADFIAVYHLKETTGTDFINSTGNSAFDLSSSATSTNITGKIGQGINFNGAYPNVVAAVVTAHPFSVTCWGKHDTLDANSILVSGSRNADHSRYWNLGIGTGAAGYKLQASTTNPGTVSAATTVGISAGNWFHAAGVWASDTDRRVFLNGGNKGTNATSLAMPTSQGMLKLGAGLPSNVNTTPNGDIDEVRIYNGILSDSRISTEEANQSDPATFATAGVPEDVGGGVSLATNDAITGHMADQVAVGHFQLLVSDNARNDQTAGQVAFGQTQSLTVNEAIHSHLSDQPTLSPGQIFTPNNILHDVASDLAALLHWQSLITFGASHGLTSDQAEMLGATGFTINPDRTYKAIRANRASSPAGGNRITQPTNNRTLRI